MKKRLIGFFEIIAFLAFMVCILPSDVFLKANAASCTASLPVNFKLTSDASKVDKTFTFEIIAQDDDAPMPSETVLSFTKSGTKKFTGFTFTELKDYHYTIVQTTTEAPGFTLDKTVYNVFIRVLNSSKTKSGLTTEITISVEGSDTKPAEISFNDSYTQASLTVTKTCRLNGERIAVDWTFYGALFSDAEGTNRVSSVKPIECTMADAGKGTVTFDNLPVGTYYFFETDSEGNVITGLIDGVWVNLEGNNGQAFTIDGENRYAEFWLANDFMQIPPKNYTYVPEEDDDPWIEEYSQKYPDYSHGNKPKPPTTTPSPVPSVTPAPSTPSVTPTPGNNTPVTGDNTHMSLYLTIGICAGALLIFLIIAKLRLSKKDKE